MIGSASSTLRATLTARGWTCCASAAAPNSPAQVTTLVIDFTGMTDFPSALFSLLAETGATLRNRDARLQMIGLNEAIDLIAGSGKPSTTASTA